MILPVWVRTFGERRADDMIYGVLQEAARAQEKFGDFASMHEAYGVLVEEMAELLEAVRMKQEPEAEHSSVSRSGRIQIEATQVAAVAMRMAEQARRVLR